MNNKITKEEIFPFEMDWDEKSTISKTDITKKQELFEIVRGKFTEKKPPLLTKDEMLKFDGDDFLIIDWNEKLKLDLNNEKRLSIDRSYIIRTRRKNWTNLSFFEYTSKFNK